MNKFDALKQFQSWPDDWQALCVEYLCVEEGIALPSPTVADQPKAAPKAAAMVPSRNQMRYTKDEVSEVDSHLSEGRGPTEIARIMNRKYPKQRTLDAWEKMANRVRKVGVEAMIQRAVDVEFRS